MKTISILILLVTLFTLPLRGVEILDCSEDVSVPFDKVYAPMNQFFKLYNPPEEIDRENLLKYLLVTCKDVVGISNVVNEISETVKDNFIVPKNISLMLGPPSNRIYYGGFLNVPRSLLIDDIAKHTNFTLAAAAHEYGHALFAENIIRDDLNTSVVDQNTKDRIKSSAELLSSMGMSVMKMEISKMDLTVLSEKMDKLKEESEQYKELEILYEKLEVELEELSSKSNDISDDHYIKYPDDRMFSTIESTYNELFADLVAVVYTGEGSIIYDVLFRTNSWRKMTNRERNEERGRDFTYKKNEISKWEVKRGMYCLLSPVRFYLWEKYGQFLHPDQTNKFKSSFLMGVLKAISKERIVLFNQSKIKFKDVPPHRYSEIFEDWLVDSTGKEIFYTHRDIKNINRSLIKAIDAALLEEDIPQLKNVVPSLSEQVN